MVATDAMKRGFSAFALKKPMIPPVIAKPEHEEEEPRRDAENDRACGEIDHEGQ